MADVIIACDVDLEPITDQPRYRIMVNDQLFTERTWIWQGQYLEENLAIRAQPGRYTIQVNLVAQDQAWVNVRNWRVISGPARINEGGQMEILHENT